MAPPCPTQRVGLLRRMYRVPLCVLSEGEVSLAKSELTLKPPEGGYDGEEGEPLVLWRETEKALYVPRFYGERVWGPPCEDRSGVGDEVSLTFCGELDPARRQVEAAEAVWSAFERGHGGCLHLPCGMGKTSLALWLAARLGRRTLVLVHKEFLVSQWRERVSQFLPGASVGVVQGPRAEVDSDVVLGMMQSVSKREYPAGTFDGFGLVVVDECHRVCARTFSRCLPKVGCRRMLGLTATPERKDGFGAVMSLHLGPVLFSASRDGGGVSVVRHVCDLGPSPLEVTYASGKVGISTMVTWLTRHRGRNELVRRLVSDELREGRRVLLLSERREHLRELLEWAEARHGAGTAGLYLGGMRRSDLEATEGRRLVLGTYAMSSEGLDIRGLHTLVLATPRTSVEQSIGRILRDADGTERRVLDLVDPYSVFAGQARKRSAFYSGAGYSVRTVDHR